MPNIVKISNLIHLPIGLNTIPTDYHFNVIKQTGYSLLLELPVGAKGGHTFDSKIDAWWVEQTSCTSAYKPGQRWMFNHLMIIEFEKDGLATVVQTFENCITYTKGQKLPKYLEENLSPTVWTYLPGQDTPTEM
jgi:hypothetical protein